MPPKDQLELLDIETADAWFEYLKETQSQPAAQYSEVEIWAWARLTGQLRMIEQRRAELLSV